MRIWLLIMFAIATLALASCQQPKPEPSSKPAISKPVVRKPIDRDGFSQEQADACAAQNGRMGRGFAGFTCITKTTDGGEICKSSADCETHCLAESGGICASESPRFGCFKVLENGHTPTLCFD